jgi:hypothetical protein
MFHGFQMGKLYTAGWAYHAQLHKKALILKLSSFSYRHLYSSSLQQWTFFEQSNNLIWWSSMLLCRAKSLLWAFYPKKKTSYCFLSQFQCFIPSIEQKSYFHLVIFRMRNQFPYLTFYGTLGTHPQQLNPRCFEYLAFCLIL